MGNMFRLILIILGCLNHLGLAAESHLSLNDVNSLSAKDFRLCAEQTVELSEGQCNDLLNLIDTLVEEPEDRLKDLFTELRASDSSVRIISFSAFLHVDSIVNLDVFRELSKHHDVSIRYLSMVYRITNDEMSAAEEMRELITSRTLSLDEKRILKTWCEACSIDVVEDSVLDIYDHIRMHCGSDDLRPKIGEQSPPFEADINGNIVKSSDFKGKPILLHFWSTTCPPCMGELDDLSSSLNPLLEDELIVVIGVSVDM